MFINNQQTMNNESENIIVIKQITNYKLNFKIITNYELNFKIILKLLLFEALMPTFDTNYFLQNNICESKTRKHNLKRFILYRKPGFKHQFYRFFMCIQIQIRLRFGMALF